MVSDSHSYRKNEAAARLIEEELQLSTPNQTPPESKPGDREAATNASRRAERRGTVDPTKIPPAAVRLAVQDAESLEHFQKLLAIDGIESEFDRRGQQKEIYGWRLRREGAEEWIKASTLAKDLSWPKISHKFLDDLDEESKTKADDRRKRGNPLMAVVGGVQSTGSGVLSLGDSELAQMPAQRVKKEMQEAPRRISKTFAALAALTNEIIAMGKEFLELVMRFVKWLLAKLGLRVEEQPVMYQQPQLTAPAPRYFLAAPENLNDQQLEDLDTQAAQQIEQVHKAIKSGDSTMLPGRDSSSREFVDLAQEIEAISTRGKTGADGDDSAMEGSVLGQPLETDAREQLRQKINAADFLTARHKQKLLADLQTARSSEDIEAVQVIFGFSKQAACLPEKAYKRFKEASEKLAGGVLDPELIEFQKIWRTKFLTLAQDLLSKIRFITPDVRQGAKREIAAAAEAGADASELLARMASQLKFETDNPEQANSDYWRQVNGQNRGDERHDQG